MQKDSILNTRVSVEERSCSEGGSEEGLKKKMGPPFCVVVAVLW